MNFESQVLKIEFEKAERMLKKTDKLIEKYKDKGNTKTVKFALPEVWWSINIYYTFIFKILIFKKHVFGTERHTKCHVRRGWAQNMQLYWSAYSRKIAKIPGADSDEHDLGLCVDNRQRGRCNCALSG